MSGMKWVILMSLQKPSFGSILENNCPEKLDKNEQTATLMEFLFSEFADLQIVNLLTQKKSPSQVFPYELCQVFQNSCFNNTYEQLLRSTTSAGFFSKHIFS